MVDVGSDFVVDSGGGFRRGAMGPNCWWILVVVGFGVGLFWWTFVVNIGSYLLVDFGGGLRWRAFVVDFGSEKLALDLVVDSVVVFLR